MEHRFGSVAHKEAGKTAAGSRSHNYQIDALPRCQLCNRGADLAPEQVASHPQPVEIEPTQQLLDLAAVRQMLLGMGVEASRLTIEDRSRDTWENAVFTKAMVAPVAGERWLLVTSAWHMPRAMGVFRKAGFAVEPWPVDYRTTGWRDAATFFGSPAEGLRRLDLVAKEYAGLVAYWLKGRSSALFPAPCNATPTCA